MSEGQPLVLQMQSAEQRGDLRSARELARAILTSASEDATLDADAQGAASQLLARTEPDPFLLVVGLAGLGLMAWLVYNYVL